MLHNFGAWSLGPDVDHRSDNVVYHQKRSSHNMICSEVACICTITCIYIHICTSLYMYMHTHDWFICVYASIYHHSLTQSTNQPTDQSINQSVNQSSHPSTSQYVCICVYIYIRPPHPPPGQTIPLNPGSLSVKSAFSAHPKCHSFFCTHTRTLEKNRNNTKKANHTKNKENLHGLPETCWMCFLCFCLLFMAFCVLVVFSFWCTFVVSNVLLRVPKNESDFDPSRKLIFLITKIHTKISSTSPSTTTIQVGNANIKFIITAM